jgi:5-methylcytosine-specific restriction protein A
VSHDAFYNLSQWKRLRDQIKRRDGYQCVQCGATGVPLDCDHIVAKDKRPDLAFVPENLRTVCRRCHNRKPTRRQPKRRNSRRW